MPLASCPRFASRRGVFPWIETAGLDQGRAHTVVLCSVRTCPPQLGGSLAPHPSKAVGSVGCICVYRPAVAAFLNPSRRSQASMTCRLPVSAGTTPRCVPCCGSPRSAPVSSRVCGLFTEGLGAALCGSACDRPHRELLPCHRWVHGADRVPCPRPGS